MGRADNIRGYVWINDARRGSRVSRNARPRFTVHYLVMWDDEPMFYDNTGAGGWAKMVRRCHAHVDTLRHLRTSGRKRPKPYDCVEAWPPSLARKVGV